MSKLFDALQELDLQGWLEQYVETKPAGGSEYRIQECPECGNGKWKLYVNVEKQRWICYVCDWGRSLGDATRLMAAISDRTPFSVRAELLQTVVPMLPPDSYQSALTAAFGEGDEEQSVDEEQPEIVLPGYSNLSSMSAQPALQYARQRGLTDQDITSNHLRSAAKLELNGKNMRGPFLVFPVFLAGKAVSWQVRRTMPSDIPYVSAPNIKDWLWPLSPQFFQHYKDGNLFLVEGVFDALGCLRLGIPALCTFGKSISEAQIQIMRDLHPDSVTFAWDVDAYRAMERVVARVAHVFTQTRVVDFSVGVEGKIDAGDTLRDATLSGWLQDRIDSAMNIRSTEFFQWRISKA